MPKKRKQATFSAAKAVKALAREKIGAPPPTKSVPAKKKTSAPEKHRPTLGQLLQED